MNSVYLAGSITGLSYQEATNWRKRFQALVGPKIKCFDPMRGKRFLENVKELGNCYEHPLATAQGIIVRDHFDCHRCDVLLVNFLDAKIVSIGTCFEIAWCSQRRIPIVLIMEPEDNIHNHAFITEAASFRSTSLIEAAEIVKAILL